MKRIFILLLFAATACLALQAQPEAVGQTGAMQLMINTWPRSSGVNGVDVASTSGIESSAINPAGLGKATGTELIFANTQWLIGSGISGNSFGFSQSLGNGSALGVVFNSIGLGQIERTTEAQPDGTLGTFSPSLLNIGAMYAKQFTDHIFVGITARFISESTPEITATGFAFDAGVQYRTGRLERVKLGIALKNIGPTMNFGGDGLNRRVKINDRNNFDSGLEIPAADFELPVVLSLGASYDFLFGDDDHCIATMLTFNSNAGYYNQLGLGIEYRYKKFLMLRGGYLGDETLVQGESRFEAHTGLAMGATLQAPFKTGKKNALGEDVFSTFSVDVSYRTTNPFGGTLTIGGRIDL